MLGVGGSVILLPTVFAACSDGDDDCGQNPTAPNCTPEAATLDLSNDTGILNYAFALEQLEAAFYTAVVGSAAFNGMTVEQREVLTDLRDHEVIHREFFRRVLGGNAIGDLALNQSTVNTAISSAANILKNAEAFEDLGVAAYNGAGKYLTTAANLEVAGKIVSVEARHAAAIRDLREGMNLAGTPANTRFAGDDVVNAMGLDVKLEPSAVLTRVVATQFVMTSVTIGAGPSGTASADFGPPNPTP
jgi:hypothetical protein